MDKNKKLVYTHSCVAKRSSANSAYFVPGRP